MKKTLAFRNVIAVAAMLSCIALSFAAQPSSAAEDELSPQVAKLRAKCEKAIRRAYPDKDDQARNNEELVLAGILELKSISEEERIAGLEDMLDRLERLRYRGIDSDGDGVDDYDDAMPAIARSPIYWDVESLSIAWNPDALRAAAAVSATSLEECFAERPVREEFVRASRVTLFDRAKWESERPGRASAASLHPFNGFPGGDARLPALAMEFCLFGSGDVGWNAIAAQRASQAFEVARLVSEVSPDYHTELRFRIHFLNLSLDTFRCRSLEIPVEVGGREIGVAKPILPPGLDHGFIVPAKDPRGVAVEFYVRLDARRGSRAWLASPEPAAPRIAVELCRGRIESEGLGASIDVTSLLRTIAASTVPFEVDGGDGRRLVWRVAPTACGRRTRVTDVFAALNDVAMRLFPSKPPLLAGKFGWPRSLASWDNGSCGLWWRAVVNGSEAARADWTESPVKSGALFFRSPDMPALADAVLKKEEYETVDPGIDFLRAMRAQEGGDTDEASAFFLRAADEGFAPAMTWFGYSRMKAGARDEALAWFSKASELGYPLGDTWFGTLSRADATACFTRAADAGQPEAETRLGMMLMKTGTKDAREEAERFLRAAAAQDYPSAQVALGIELSQSGDDSDLAESAYWFRNAARNGSAEGQTHFAMAQRDGAGVPRSQKESVAWLTLAATRDYAPALVELGKCYFDGRGVARNPRRAVELFGKAAEHGNLEGEFLYGACILKGARSREDLQKGRGYIARAADAGNPMAQFIDGIVSMRMSEPENAAARFHQAAMRGVVPAQVWYGYCLSSGTGVKQDKAAAREWFGKAAAAGVDVSGYLGETEE